MLLTIYTSVNSIPAEAGVDEVAPPKAKDGAAGLADAPNINGWAGAAKGAAGVSCACCPKTKVFAGVASEAVLCPNKKVLEGAEAGAGAAGAGAGAEAWSETERSAESNRLGEGVARDGALDEAAAMKPKAGFAADASGERERRMKLDS